MNPTGSQHYRHLVNSTEECQAINGDADDILPSAGMPHFDGLPASMDATGQMAVYGDEMLENHDQLDQDQDGVGDLCQSD